MAIELAGIFHVREMADRRRAHCESAWLAVS